MITEYKIACEGVGKKVIYHLNDSHLTEYDARSTEEERESALKRTESWERVRADFARCYGEPYGDRQKQPPAKHFENLLAEAEKGDALVIAGDMMDYVSPANLRFCDKALGGFKKPFLAVCGNHEKAEEIPADSLLAAMREPVQTLDLGDLLIIGLDNSRRLVTREQNEELERLLSGGKKAVVVMHVPIMCPANEERLRQNGQYFQFNYDSCPRENLDCIEIIKSHEKDIAAVLAGHLHYLNAANLTKDLFQFVASQAIVGNMNRYVIGDYDEIR
ncbi:MAG: metallophosphoesterase [Clostridia bacterium]|nr:metallophosphoesterase [Clostridia bacterium]